MLNAGYSALARFLRHRSKDCSLSVLLPERGPQIVKSSGLQVLQHLLAWVGVSHDVGTAIEVSGKEPQRKSGWCQTTGLQLS